MSTTDSSQRPIVSIDATFMMSSFFQGPRDIPKFKSVSEDLISRLYEDFVSLCAYEVYCEYQVALYEDYDTYSVIRQWERNGREISEYFPPVTHNFHRLGDIGLMILDSVSSSMWAVRSTDKSLLVSYYYVNLSLSIFEFIF